MRRVIWLPSERKRVVDDARTAFTAPFAREWNDATHERLDIRAPRTPGVYFIEAVGTGFVKIGRSKNIAERLAALRAQNGAKLRLLRWDAGGSKEERELHARFGYYRSHGEWFIVFPHLANHMGWMPSSMHARWLAQLDRVQRGDFSQGIGQWPDSFDLKRGADA